MNQYRSGELRLIVATDVAARGLDVKDISYVINYDFPVDGVEVSHPRRPSHVPHATRLQLSRQPSMLCYARVERRPGELARFPEVEKGRVSLCQLLSAGYGHDVRLCDRRKGSRRL